MAESMTELDLVVGSMITTRPDEDRDAYEEEREWLPDVQDLLREEGVDAVLAAPRASRMCSIGCAKKASRSISSRSPAPRCGKAASAVFMTCTSSGGWLPIS